MRKIILLLVMGLFAGCLTARRSSETSYWLLERPAGLAESTSTNATFGVVRLSQVSVRPPYDVRTFAVLREDGTVAFDDYNQFAASPTSLLKGFARDVAVASGRFSDVLDSSSAVNANGSLEIVVTRLALDCRAEGRIECVVRVGVRLLGKTHHTLAYAEAEGRAPAGGSDYSAAFSQAVAAALDVAYGRL